MPSCLMVCKESESLLPYPHAGPVAQRTTAMQQRTSLSSACNRKLPAIENYHMAGPGEGAGWGWKGKGGGGVT